MSENVEVYQEFRTTPPGCMLLLGAFKLLFGSLVPLQYLTESGSDRASHSLRLKHVSCSCRVAGRAAAVRLATSPAAIEDAKREAAVYERLEHLQGHCVPRLLAHGPTLKGGAYFVATEFMKVRVAAAYT